MGGTSEPRTRALRGRRRAPTGGARRPPAPAHQDGERGLGRRPLVPHARSAGRCRDLARACGRALPRELAGCASGQLGEADRSDEVASSRGRSRARGGRGLVGARSGGCGVGEPDRAVRGGTRRARPRGRRTRCRSGRRASRARRFPRAGRGFARGSSQRPTTTRYDAAIRALLADFEGRTDFLEDIPVADTVLVLQLLAGTRGIVVDLESALLPQ